MGKMNQGHWKSKVALLWVLAGAICLITQ